MRKNLFPVFLLAIFTLLLSGCLSGESTSNNAIDALVPEVMAAQTDAVVRILPAEVQIGTGSIATLDIQIDNVTNLVAAEVKFLFDPAILQAQDSNPNQEGIQMQPNESFLSGFIVNKVDNQTGVATYAVTQLAPFSPVSGSGILASISFQPVAQGTSEIPFVTVILSNENVELIPSTAEPGKIIVSGGPVITGTPTNTPTATATTDPNLPTNTPTHTPTPSSTPTITPTPTETLTPTSTFTPIPPTLPPPPTVTHTPTPTNTPVSPENMCRQEQHWVFAPKLGRATPCKVLAFNTAWTRTLSAKLTICIRLGMLSKTKPFLCRQPTAAAQTPTSLNITTRWKLLPNGVKYR